MASSTSAVTPKWVIDLHGVKEALTTSSNQVRASVIDAIQSGEMLVLRSVSDELHAAYPKIWDDFKDIKPRKYLTPTLSTINTASQLVEAYGASLIGSIPTFEHFEAVAAAKMTKCKLVTAGKALNHCSSIASKCKLPSDTVIDPGSI